MVRCMPSGRKILDRSRSLRRMPETRSAISAASSVPMLW